MHHYPPHLELPEAAYLPEGDGRYVSTALTAGPWDPNGQHAGASAALLAHCMEHHGPPGGGTDDGAPPFLARLTVDLLRPAPVAPLEIEVRTVRAGRRAHWMEATASAVGPEGSVLVARASGLRVVSSPVDLPPVAFEQPGAGEAPPPPATVVALTDWSETPWLMFWHGMDFRPYKGGHDAPGPGGVWFNLEAPLVSGVPTSPLMRAVTAADFALGISGVLDFSAFAYPNADLSVHLFRYPEGPWVALDAVSLVDAQRGGAIAEAALWDESGRIGRAVQTLVVSER